MPATGRFGKNSNTNKKQTVLSKILRFFEKFFGIKSDLKLWVKVKEDWRNRQGIIHTLGLD